MHSFNRQWIQEAEAAIRKANPAAAAVVDASRSFAVFGRPGVLTARLADGTQWRVDEEIVRQLTPGEITERERLRESFQ